MPQTISVLGSTGSIGKNTLDLVRQEGPDNWQVEALTAHSNAEKLAEQAIEFSAKFVALANPDKAGEIHQLLAGRPVEIGIGPEALIAAAKRGADFTMSAIVGAAGLEPTLAAVDTGNRIGLANKECLVCAGDLFMQRVQEKGATLLPVDSEHNAIFQVLERDKYGSTYGGVKRLILTASGGPFRETSFDDLKAVTREQALKHPVWSMGAKISIDSATLMNKGLELIEASYLFDYPSTHIDVIIHPQSIIHSMVEYIDGSILAQLGSPDMRTPIAYAMGWPRRMATPVKPLDLTEISSLTFFEPDTERFPALHLSRGALEMGGKAPNTLNAANEVAVAAFLAGRIGFTDIAKIVGETLEQSARGGTFLVSSRNIDCILNTDTEARAVAFNVIKAL